ncbi:T9SS type A sorting domain-containing protein [Lewinella sp. W8]|uniref:T9SS type A sorting domain-containing protein n=1 Tax=Lewinella sp. W8 TaxID=2528208 RepID=UPI001068874B|nr:T9SS type A sorting domain-containing protein [Lewinella sp. W8]MTB53700.1 T9SS type A sorting domain-containing protein [Lewinella sp. W8]
MKTPPITLICLLLLGTISPPGFAQSNTIVDIQTVNIGGGSDASTFLGSEVTVTGVVTASAEADNLGYIYIQQEGATEWAGIPLVSGGPDLISLAIGDKVEVTGTVDEVGGMTVLENISQVNVTGTGTIEPLELDPALFTTYGLATNEQYEGMLVRFSNPGGLIHVVEVNADVNNNFGEWRIGTNPATPQTGCRVLTGRATASVSSSLNVSYINDEFWATNNGRLNVPARVVTTDTAFQSVTGLISYGSGNLKLLPRNNDDFVQSGTTANRSLANFLSGVSVSPNPVSTTTTLTFTVLEPTEFSVEVLDVSGRMLVRERARQPWPPGTHRMPLRALQSLPAGIYLVQLAGPRGAFPLRMLKQE